jgi:hypothetical protein
MFKRRRVIIQLSAIGLVSAMAATSVIADVIISGKADGLELTATQSTVKEALQHLSSSYGLELHGVDELDEPLSGSFKGSLSSVVDQLLAAHNHFMRPNGAGLALFVTDAKPKATTTAAAGATEPTADDPVKAELENPIVLSPQGQEMAVKMFGEKGRKLQVDETLLQSFFGNRGGRRYVGGAATATTH